MICMVVYKRDKKSAKKTRGFVCTKTGIFSGLLYMSSKKQVAFSFAFDKYNS